MDERICEWCGKTFLKTHPLKRFCNRGCKTALEVASRPRIIGYAHCATCGRLFTAHGKVRGALTRCEPVTCSPECWRLHANATHRAAEALRGPAFKELKEMNSAKRRARLLSVEYERFGLREIAERDRWRCGLCGQRVPRSSPDKYVGPSLDHIIPISLGGSHTRANVHLTHLRCNLRKHTQPKGEQLMLIG